MSLTDDKLFLEKPQVYGVQRVYRQGDLGLSVLTASQIHKADEVWEASLVIFDGDKFQPFRDVPMLRDGTIMPGLSRMTVLRGEEDANAFIADALEFLGRVQAGD